MVGCAYAAFISGKLYSNALEVTARYFFFWRGHLQSKLERVTELKTSGKTAEWEQDIITKLRLRKQH